MPIVYEDDDLLVLNKPYGVIVHPAPSVSSITLVDLMLQAGVSLHIWEIIDLELFIVWISILKD